jgi:hypothetical protein
MFLIQEIDAEFFVLVEDAKFNGYEPKAQSRIKIIIRIKPSLRC